MSNLLRFVGTPDQTIFLCQQCGGQRSRFTHTLLDPSEEPREIDGKLVCFCAHPIEPREGEMKVSGFDQLWNNG
jgi:hypothetical protein